MSTLFSALDSPGGHIVTCLTLLMIGAAFSKFGIPKSEDIIIFALGVLARSMYGAATSNGVH